MNYSLSLKNFQPPYQIRIPYLKTNRLIAAMKRCGLTLRAMMRANEIRMEAARLKIAEAVWSLIEQGRHIGRCAIQKLTGCHPDTINKHRDLWDQSYIDQEGPGDLEHSDNSFSRTDIDDAGTEVEMSPHSVSRGDGYIDPDEWDRSFRFTSFQNEEPWWVTMEKISRYRGDSES